MSTSRCMSTMSASLSASCSSLVISPVVASTAGFTTSAAPASALSSPFPMVGSPTAMSPPQLAVSSSAASPSSLSYRRRTHSFACHPRFGLSQMAGECRASPDGRHSDAGTALGTVHTRRSTRGQRPWASARADSGPHCAAASVGACCLSGRVACVQARGFLILTRISHETSPTEG